MESERDLARKAIASGVLGGRDGPVAPEKYELGRCLGEGGGGAVYLARDRHLGRPVALKFLRDARPLEVERFVREARFAARLNNPSIVQVYEAGEVDGLPYIAMQYIEGENLGEAQLSVSAVLAAVCQAADALAHAHREGIVHRDIKPENILLDREGRAYVSDFGIARDLRGELGATMSAEGQIMGTPALMPPEQARGDVAAVDARSDIYSLGATMYFKLTGRWPFEAHNIVDMLHAVIHADPPFPRSFDPSIPRAVEEVVLRCMRKRRRDRYVSMHEVGAALRDCLEEKKALSSAWFASYVRETIPDAPAPAADPDDEPGELHEALQVAREIAGWDAHLYRVRSNLPKTFGTLDTVIGRLDQVLDEQPATGWARYYRGLARFRRGDLRGAREDMERSIDRVRDHAGAYFELGRLYLALYLDEHREAHKHITRMGTKSDLASALSRLEQAGLAFAEARRMKDLPPWQAEYADAVKHLAEGDFEGCVAVCEKILAADPDLEEVWKLCGDAQRRLGADPIPAYDRALEIRRSDYGAELSKAEVYFERGDHARARASLERALEIHPGLAAARVLLARTLAQTGDPDGALELAQVEAEKSYDAAVLLAELHLDRTRPDEALAALEFAKKLPGCQNRVRYVAGQALLQRRTPADLEQLIEMCDEHMQFPEHDHWAALREDARAARGRS